MFKIFKLLFCKHNYNHVYNIHGDEINHSNNCRSVWKCEKCSKIKLHNNINYDNDAIKRSNIHYFGKEVYDTLMHNFKNNY